MYVRPLMGLLVKRVVWHAVSDDADLSLRVKGQCGIMAREQDVSYITVQGAVNQPLATPTMAIHARTLTLALDGNARTGSFLMPSLIFSL